MYLHLGGDFDDIVMNVFSLMLFTLFRANTKPEFSLSRIMS